MEGAGSPAELNLRSGDLVNMAIAEYAQAPVLLVGDIDRGGIFAQLLGTVWLLEENERARVRGLIVNKFRGDQRLFFDGVKILEDRSGIGVLGVVPFIHDLRIADEDSVALETVDRVSRSVMAIDVAVISLPHMSNFDDFDPLRAEVDVSVRFVNRVEDVGQPDLLILPGTKTTTADLRYLHERGLSGRIVELAHRGVPVLGICGGYQMLGETIHDPSGVESDESEVQGLGLLPVTTTFAAEKHTVRARGCIQTDRGLFANARGLEVTGYEIHMGRTSQQPQARCTPLQRVLARGEEVAGDDDGAVSEDGMIVGTYFHGLFENDALRHALIAKLAARKGWTRHTVPTRFDRNVEYDRLAETVRAHLNLDEVYRILGTAQ